MRRVRLARGLSLRQVAERAGLSVGFLSQVERGLSSAAVRVLAVVADALDVAVADFFDGRDQDSGHVVTRAHERGSITFGPDGGRKELLTVHGEQRGLDLFFIHLGPGDSSGPDPYSHCGIEAAHVIAGGIELEVDRRTYLLGEGDSCGFPSSRPHRFKNAGRRDTLVLWANYRGSGEKTPGISETSSTATSTEILP
ncbi:helix-turn-helix domain-containing protein [Nitratireductor soli]|uniref:helix-turn-helix domain-containing protein n=1 Tax=Nitratireductor soli TaxID=1670619 RepID=UPI00065DC7E4|nr:cupin domain-containing protein [Nitratireductor soli]